MQFDGMNDYVDLGASSTLHHSGNFSVGMWINIPEVPSQNGEVIIGDYQGYYKGYSLYVNTAGKIYFGVGRQSDSTTQDVTSTQVLTLNTWYHIVATYDGAPNVFVNAIKTTGVTYSPIEAETGNTRIGIGQWVTRYFNGTIDEVQIYNRSLTADEIKELYESRVQ